MPIRPPSLDDRSFDDLVEELIARIPAHTPEWTDPRPGDPGRTLIDLFAWLGDTLLYRANLIPERQRLAFLRLLGIPMRPAIAAQGLVSLAIDDKTIFRSETIQPLATLTGAVNFETRQEITIHPVQVAVYCKQRLSEDQLTKLTPVVEQLQVFYNLGNQNNLENKTKALPYITTPVFSSGQIERDSLSIKERTIDHCLWLALLAPQPDQTVKDAVTQALGTSITANSNLLNIGIVPALTLPESLVDLPIASRIPHVWEISIAPQASDTQPRYLPLTVVSDSTQGLTRSGIVRVSLPAASQIGAPSNDVRQLDRAGVGDYPPRIDTPEIANRLVAWIRLRPLSPSPITGQLATEIPLPDIRLSWIGINAVAIDQRQTLRDRIIGQSDGTADQVFDLPGQSVEEETLKIQVEETGRGYQAWSAIADLALAQPQSVVYQLNAEAGTIRFGDGMRGRVPEVGARIRVALVRLGGGDRGNLPSGSLTTITATRLTGGSSVKLKVMQPIPTTGGDAAETLEQAERRIPALFRHRDRAITITDYQNLASETPGVSLGRVEVLPRFKPQQRRQNVAGVVSVMVLPSQTRQIAPNPRPDRPTLERIHSYLESRRPLGTELYVIGCEYKPLGLSVGIEIADGFERDQVLLAVRSSLQQFLWPLAPGGAAGRGWALGRPVQERELIVVVARVAGVSEVLGLNLFYQPPNEARWRRLLPVSTAKQNELSLEPWQLPELLSIVVLADIAPLDDLDATTLISDRASIPVPVVLEVC
jgi:predicted phage baseplate assembly protein